MNERRVAVEDGKYTFVLKPGEYRVHVLRHGEPWLVIEQGCNAVWALAAWAADASTLVAAVRRWATQGDGFQQHGEMHQAFRALCDESGERKPPALEVDRSIEFALSSSAQFLESLLAEPVPGQRIRLQAALEGVQRALGVRPAPRRDPSETLRELKASLDADVLRDDYPQELVDAELRNAGCDPAELVARNRPKIDEMLEKRRAAQSTFVLTDAEADDLESIRGTLHRQIEDMVNDGAEEFAAADLADLRRQWTLLGKVVQMRSGK